MASQSIARKALLKKTYRPTSKLEVFYTGGRVALSRDGSFVVCPCSEEVKVGLMPRALGYSIYAV
jgi:hypothetical protein